MLGNDYFVDVSSKTFRLTVYLFGTLNAPFIKLAWKWLDLCLFRSYPTVHQHYLMMISGLIIYEDKSKGSSVLYLIFSCSILVVYDKQICRRNFEEFTIGENRNNRETLKMYSVCGKMSYSTNIILWSYFRWYRNSYKCFSSTEAKVFIKKKTWSKFKPINFDDGNYWSEDIYYGASSSFWSHADSFIGMDS